MGINQDTTAPAETTEAVLEHVDPTTLVVDANVRTEATWTGRSSRRSQSAG
ncbi:hypothetical protein [Williamsia deligens]|uniref:hypothetical protein n=1 Tax=Williamsia deligens TaxID=321325 RepID=UPI0020A26F54|nr:hypothetical protein [Williamsia deligens]MCP2193407.1 hypothetical protein [Williamsia deligens]